AVTVEFGGVTHAVGAEKISDAGTTFLRSASAGKSTMPSRTAGELHEVPLRRIAHGRSGDKGNTSNIGLIARDPAYLAVIREQVTPEAVAAWFAHLVHGPVVSYEWPGLHAINFVMSDALGGGGIASLRFDPQGKGLAQNLLEMPVRVPVTWKLVP
ncbi:MAG: terpene utilization protein AtuA, partial [Polyangiaceae bacterium]